MERDFKILSEEYLLSLLNEAPGNVQQTNQTQTTFSNEPNTTYEPQEQDASMGIENDMGEGSFDPGMEEMDMGSGNNMSGDMTMGGDPSMGLGSPSVNVKDIFKKRKLFNDYKALLEVIEELLGTTNKILSRDLSDDAQKIYMFVNQKMEENKQKVLIILTEQYLILPYKQLLTLYMYIKIATKSYADIVKQISVMYQ